MYASWNANNRIFAEYIITNLFKFIAQDRRAELVRQNKAALTTTTTPTTTNDTSPTNMESNNMVAVSA